MATNFFITHNTRDGKLHVSPRGDFDANSAWELYNLLDEKYNNQGQVVIETQHLKNVCPFGCSTFQYQMCFSRIPRDRLFFQGDKGPLIAPKGSSIINLARRPRGRGTGHCANCRYRPENSKLIS